MVRITTEDADGTWSHKPGSWLVYPDIQDPIADARKYTEVVGYFYIKEKCEIE